jgi:hypothetical protein
MAAAGALAQPSTAAPAVAAPVLTASSTAKTSAGVRSFPRAKRPGRRRDKQAPRAPRRLTVTRAGQTSLSLAWKRSKDNVAVVSYRVYKNGAVAGRTSKTRYTLSALRCSKRYRLSVRAFDAARNYSRKAVVMGSTRKCGRGGPPQPTPRPPPPGGAALPPLLGDSPGPALYVSPFGSDAGNNCRSNLQPCRTIQRAIDVCAPGSTINVHGGTYAQSLVVFAGASSARGCQGRASAPVTLRSFPGELATIVPSGALMLRVSMGTRYWKFARLRWQANATLPQGTGNPGLWVSDSAGADGVRTNHIEFIQNEFLGQGVNSTGFLASPLTDSVFVVSTKVTGWGTGAEQRQGIYHQGQHGLLMNNVIYGLPNGFGISLRGDSSTLLCANTIVTHNTVVDVAGQRGIYVENNCRGLRIRNNVVAYSAQEELYGLLGAGDDPPAGSNRAFTNVLYDTTRRLTGNTAGHTILDYSDGRGDYQGTGANRVANPLFANRAARDYHLLAGSPAIGYADPAYSPAFDHDGRSRDSAPDAGAYER